MKRSTLSLCGSFLQCSLMPGSLYVPVQLLDCSLFSSKRLCLTSGGSQELCHQLCHSEINYNMPLQWKNKTLFQLVCCRLRLKAFQALQ